MRIRKAAGVSRTGSRIRAQITRGVLLGASRRLYRRDTRDFLWRIDHETVEVRRRDGGDIPPSLRKPGMIAREEVSEALIHAVRVSYGIAPDDAVQEAIRLFGFRRAGRGMVEHFQQVLGRLVGDRFLVREGDLLQLPDSGS